MDTHMTLIAGVTVVEARTSVRTLGRVGVALTVDGQPHSSFEMPAWRPLSYGCAPGVAYLWSARQVVSIRIDRSNGPKIFEVDEDLLFVFNLGSRWLLVCETSLRLLTDGIELDRIELGEVVESARWESDSLVVRDSRGFVTRARADGDHFWSSN